MNRQQRRALKKKVGADVEEKISNQMAQFNKLPEFCNACHKEFDKKDKDMVLSWSVVVKQDLVRLFCPDCINKAKEVIDASNQNIE